MNNPAETRFLDSDLPAKLAQPARRALVQAGYLRLEQFTQLRVQEVQKLHGRGPKAIELIRQALADSGKSFAE